MNYKSFVFALGLLIVSSNCIYAQNKGKNVTKAVEAAVTKKVPGAAIKAGAEVAATSNAARVTAATAAKVSAARSTAVNAAAKASATPKTSAAASKKMPAAVSGTEMVERMKSQYQAAMQAKAKAAQAPAPLPRPQFIPQFEDIDYGYNVIGLRDAVEEFAVAHNRRGPRDMREINRTFEDADYRFKKEIENGNYFKPYQEVWLDAAKDAREIGRVKQSLKLYTESDSPLQPLFNLRNQQLQHALNPGEVARPVDQRFVLLDETSVRVAKEIKSLAKNLNVHDPLRAEIQDELGVLEEQTAEGTSSRAFLDIFHQLPNLGGEVFEFGTAHSQVGSHIEYFSRVFEWADEKVFVKQGNKVYANPNIPKGTSYVKKWKEYVDGRSVRVYMLPESPFQKAFELRQEQLDYLLSDRDNFLVDPSLGNEATARTAREIQDKLSGLPENNPLRMRIEKDISLERYANIGQ